MTPTERLHRLTDFWGYGNPYTARILLIGIEEGSEWSEQEIRKQQRGDESLEESVNRLVWHEGKDYALAAQWEQQTNVTSPRNTERMQALLAMKVRSSIFGDKSFMPCQNEFTYFSGHFLRRWEFQSNVYPIACRNSASWNREDLERWFGIMQSKAEFRSTVLGHRLEVLRRVIDVMTNQFGPPVIFLMGKKELWASPSVFSQLNRHLFGDKGFHFAGESSQRAPFGHDAERRIWLLRHPSYPRWFNYEYVQMVLSHMTETNVGVSGALTTCEG